MHTCLLRATRYTPKRHTSIRYTPVRYTPMRHPPIRCTLVGCTPVRHKSKSRVSVAALELGFRILFGTCSQSRCSSHTGVLFTLGRCLPPFPLGFSPSTSTSPSPIHLL